MGRRARQDVDYFPHDCDASTRKTLIILESRFGNDGFAAWFKLLESLGRRNGLFIDCSDSRELKLLSAAAHVSTGRYEDILDEAASLEAIDFDLWQNHKIIWSDNFVERLKPVFAKRKLPPPLKPVPAQKSGYPTRESVFPFQKSPDIGVSGAETPQRKGKERKGKKSAETDVPDSLLDLSREFHSIQRTAFPMESCWRTDEQFEQTVVAGAVELERLRRLDGWEEAEIRRVLAAIPSNDFWAANLKSLRGARKKSPRNQAMKIENARTSIDERAQGGNGLLSYNQMLAAVGQDGLVMNKDFRAVESGGQTLWQRT